MNISFFEVRADQEKELQEMVASNPELKDAKINISADKLSLANIDLAKDSEVISVFINSTVSKEIIDALPNLKFIETRSTGYDHIDSAYAFSKGIKVANVPAYGSRTVAEYAFALILGLSRKTLLASNQIKLGGGFDISHFRGFDLQGKTLGIVGTGKIGLNVAKIAKGFDLNVIAFDVFPNQEQADKLGFKYLPLKEVLNQSDIVTIHVPYNKQTFHLINKENIHDFKRGALLVNTARGEICDTEAILEGVQEKILSGVALDVLEGERELKEEDELFGDNAKTAPNGAEIKTLLEDHILMGLPEVFITPHIAFFTVEAEREIMQVSLNNIVGFKTGGSLNLIKV